VLLGSCPRGDKIQNAVQICRLTIAIISVFSLAGIIYAQFRPVTAPPAVKPQILRVIKHDPAAFTQGLFIDSLLYESTGLDNESTLRRVDPKTGNVITSIPVAEVFAEGITALGSELVQLTWKHGFALRYEFPSLKLKNVKYQYQGEGWGLTNNGKQFIMSNGTDTLYFRNEKFDVVRKLPVTHAGKPLVYLNELEYARGHVYANVWYRDFIAEISVGDGRVVRVIDCSELVAIEGTSRDNVLNGIAYCERKDEWYLTGKNWKNMFIVKIP
jgi:glutamine cyclotransferase